MADGIRIPPPIVEGWDKTIREISTTLKKLTTVLDDSQKRLLKLDDLFADTSSFQRFADVIKQLNSQQAQDLAQVTSALAKLAQAASTAGDSKTLQIERLPTALTGLAIALKKLKEVQPENTVEGVAKAIDLLLKNLRGIEGLDSRLNTSINALAAFVRAMRTLSQLTQDMSIQHFRDSFEGESESFLGTQLEVSLRYLNTTMDQMSQIVAKINALPEADSTVDKKVSQTINSISALLRSLATISKIEAPGTFNLDRLNQAVDVVADISVKVSSGAQLLALFNPNATKDATESIKAIVSLVETAGKIGSGSIDIDRKAVIKLIKTVVAIVVPMKLIAGGLRFLPGGESLDNLSKTLSRMGNALDSFRRFSNFNLNIEEVVRLLKGLGAIILSLRGLSAFAGRTDRLVAISDAILSISKIFDLLRNDERTPLEAFKDFSQKMILLVRGLRQLRRLPSRINTRVLRDVAQVMQSIGSVGSVRVQPAAASRFQNNIAQALTFGFGNVFAEIFVNKLRKGISQISDPSNLQSVGQELRDAGEFLLNQFGLDKLFNNKFAQDALAFDDLRNQLQVFGASLPQDEVVAFAEVIGQRYPASATEALQATLNLAKAGIDSVGSIKAILPTAADLQALADNSSLERTIKFLIAAESGFDRFGEGYRGTFENLQLVSDAVFQASVNSTASVDNLFEGLEKVAPTANRFGETLVDVTAFLTIFEDANIRASEAGNLLSTVLGELSKPKAREELSRLNVAYSRQDGTLRGLDEILTDVSAAYERLNFSQLEVANSLAELGGDKFGQQGLSILLGRGGIQNIVESMGLLQEGTLSAADAAQKLLESVQGQLEQLAGSFSTLMNKAFQPLLQNFLLPAIKLARTLVDSLLQLPGPLVEVLSTSALVGSALLTFAGISALLGGTLLTLTGFVQATTIAFVRMTLFLPFTIIQMTLLKGSLLSVLAIFAGFGGVVLATGAAIVGAITAIRNNVGGVGDAFNAVFGELIGVGQEVKRIVETLVDAFTTLFDRTFSRSSGEGVSALTAILERLGNGLEFFRSQLEQIDTERIAQFAYRSYLGLLQIVDGVSQVGESLVQLFSGDADFTETFVSGFAKIRDTAVSVVSVLFGRPIGFLLDSLLSDEQILGLARTLERAFDGVQSALSGVVRLAQEILLYFQPVIDQVSYLFNVFGRFLQGEVSFQNLGEVILNTVSTIGTALLDSLQLILQTVIPAAGELINNLLTTLVRNLFSHTGVGQAGQPISTFIAQSILNGLDALKNVGDLVLDVIGTIGEQAGSILSNFFQELGDGLGIDLFGRLRQFIQDADWMSVFFTVAEGLFTALREGVRLIPQVIAELGNLTGSGFLRTLGNALLYGTHWDKVFQALTDGIRNVINGVVDFAGDFAGQLINTFFPGSGLVDEAGISAGSSFANAVIRTVIEILNPETWLNILGATFNAALDIIATILLAPGRFIAQLNNSIKNEKITAILGNIMGLLPAIVQLFLALDGVIVFLIDRFQMLANFVGDALGGIYTTIQTLMELPIFRILDEIVEGLGTLVAILGGTLVVAITAVIIKLGGLRAALAATGNAIKTVATQGVPALIRGVKAIPGLVKSLYDAVSGWLGMAAAVLIAKNAMVNFDQVASRNIVGGLLEVMTGITTDIFRAVGMDDFADRVENTMSQVAEAIEFMFEDAVRYVNKTLATAEINTRKLLAGTDPWVKNIQNMSIGLLQETDDVEAKFVFQALSNYAREFEDADDTEARWLFGRTLVADVDGVINQFRRLIQQEDLQEMLTFSTGSRQSLENALSLLVESGGAGRGIFALGGSFEDMLAAMTASIESTDPEVRKFAEQTINYYARIVRDANLNTQDLGRAIDVLTQANEEGIISASHYNSLLQTMTGNTETLIEAQRAAAGAGADVRYNWEETNDTLAKVSEAIGGSVTKLADFINAAEDTEEQTERLSAAYTTLLNAADAGLFGNETLEEGVRMAREYMDAVLREMGIATFSERDKLNPFSQMNMTVDLTDPDVELPTTDDIFNSVGYKEFLAELEGRRETLPFEFELEPTFDETAVDSAAEAIVLEQEEAAKEVAKVERKIGDTIREGESKVREIEEDYALRRERQAEDHHSKLLDISQQGEQSVEDAIAEGDSAAAQRAVRELRDRRSKEEAEQEKRNRRLDEDMQRQIERERERSDQRVDDLRQEMQEQDKSHQQEMARLAEEQRLAQENLEAQKRAWEEQQRAMKEAQAQATEGEVSRAEEINARLEEIAEEKKTALATIEEEGQNDRQSAALRAAQERVTKLTAEEKKLTDELATIQKSRSDEQVAALDEANKEALEKTKEGVVEQSKIWNEELVAMQEAYHLMMDNVVMTFSTRMQDELNNLQSELALDLSEFTSAVSTGLTVIGDNIAVQNPAIVGQVVHLQNLNTTATAILGEVQRINSGSGGGSSSWLDSDAEEESSGSGSIWSRITDAFFGGNRALGGPVQPGKFYGVADGDVPEILSMGGRQYLLPSSRGFVTPIPSANPYAGSQTHNYGSVNVSVPITIEGSGADASEIVRRVEREVVPKITEAIRRSR